MKHSKEKLELNWSSAFMLSNLNPPTTTSEQLKGVAVAPSVWLKTYNETTMTAKWIWQPLDSRMSEGRVNGWIVWIVFFHIFHIYAGLCNI